MTHRRSQANRIRSDQNAAGLGSGIEALERRLLLAAQPFFRPAPPPLVAPATNDIADVKVGPMANAGSQLINLYRDYRRFKNAGGADADYDHPLFEQVMRQGTKVGVTVRGRGTLEQLTTRLRQSGSEIIYRSGRWIVIDAYVPIGQLHELARDPGVATINPLYHGKTQQQGVADNQADFVQKTDRVRRNFGLDGSGVRVGVLSDSLNRFDKGLPGSVATGDLPANIHVVSDSPIVNPLGAFLSPTDEGRAMLELIHDIAPKAELAFATSDFGAQAFADYIRALRAAGSDVIVDDIRFINESQYQPSVIDEAIADVVADGAVYLSSGGNLGPDSGYEAMTNFTKVGRHRFVDFDPGPGVDTRLRVEVASGGLLTLFWDNPYNGVVGQATTDLDIFVYDATYGRLRTNLSGIDNNIKTGVPLELFSLPAGRWDIEIRVMDHVEGQQLPTRFRLRGANQIGFTSFEYEPLNRASVGGHNNGENTIGVGAVPWFAPSENEGFSSNGPFTRVFDAAGNRLSEPLSLEKPDISGIDAVNTSFFPQPIPSPFGNLADIPEDDDDMSNFFGTSAAAPNVAALVALIRQATPDASRAEILQALKDTAVPLNGSTGGYDEQGGYGLVDGLDAINRFVSPPTVHIQQVRPDPRVTPVDHVKIVFSQRVIGFDVSDLTLTREGGPNLLTGAQTLQSTDGGRTWLLRNLRSLTDEFGSYTVTLVAEGSGIINTSTLAQPLEFGADETWQHIEFPGVPTPPSNLRAKVVDVGVVRLRWDDNSGNEDYFLVQRAEDKDFTAKVKTFRVPFDTTVFTDQVILPVGKRIFYRVRAVNNFSEFEQSTNVVEVFLPARGEIILDNESSKGVTFEGGWSFASETPGFLGESYADDEDADKGLKSASFKPNIPRSQEYFVYVRWVRAERHATNVPIDVVYGAGQKRTFLVDQRNTGGDGWVLLGKFNFLEGRNGLVRVRTDGTDGLVTIDAVRFQPTTGAT